MSEVHDHDGQGPHSHASDAIEPYEMLVRGRLSGSTHLQPGSRFELSLIPSFLEITTVPMHGGEEWIVYNMHDPAGVRRHVFPPYIAMRHHAQLGKLLDVESEGEGQQRIETATPADLARLRSDNGHGRRWAG